MWDFRVLIGKVKIEAYVLDSGNMLFIENSSSTISHDVGTGIILHLNEKGIRSVRPLIYPWA